MVILIIPKVFLLNKIAVAYGAKIIEKHITLSKKMSGPDHIASLDLVEFKDMCIAIRKVEKILVKGIKKI